MESFLEKYENKETVADWMFRFGKHKGSTFKDVFDSDPSYVAFLFKTLDKEKNAAMLDYFRERVENNYTNPVEEKKIRKTKKTNT